MTKKTHRKILGGEWENFGWRMGKFWVENGKIWGREWENFQWSNIFGGECLKKVIASFIHPSSNDTHIHVRTHMCVHIHVCDDLYSANESYLFNLTSG